MTRNEMIAALKAHCKELDEKKLQFERMIHALRLEDDAENDAAGDDVIADSEDEEK
ncbi:hypothetical protein A2U01_0058713, partial [Trifolium medium]|nr:hypothetical protein [Trifolium medium]